MATGDFDGAFARLQAGDAEVVQEPTDQPLAEVDWSRHVIRVRQARVYGRTRKEAKTDEDHDMQTTGWAV
jgi:hypothetical protein